MACWKFSWPPPPFLEYTSNTMDHTEKIAAEAPQSELPADAVPIVATRNLVLFPASCCR